MGKFEGVVASLFGCGSLVETNVNLRSLGYTFVTSFLYIHSTTFFIFTDNNVHLFVVWEDHQASQLRHLYRMLN